MPGYKNIVVPKNGKKIGLNKDKSIKVPSNPIVPFIEGDGTGPDIWKAAQHVLDTAVQKTYKGKRKIEWMEIYAGEKSLEVYGKDQWLPEETLKAIKDFRIAIKGPLTTPIGGGIRSINVALRQELDLYSCVRPVRWFEGVPAPVIRPQDLDVVIFRENTEDVYSGIEFAAGEKATEEILKYLRTKTKKPLRPKSSIGIKPVSAMGSKRLVTRAIQYAIDNKLPSVTLVHKGNIMKFTEGYFCKWGYEVAKSKFRNKIVTEDEVYSKYKGKTPKGKILIRDRIADAMFQQLLLRPSEYSVIATMNLNGDYLSDACAAQVGGLGLAPGANIGDKAAIFEATHGTAPKYAGLDKINPGSVILSGVMMLDHLGWSEAGAAIVKAMESVIKKKTVTYDLARQMKGAKEIKCSEFGNKIANAI